MIQKSDFRNFMLALKQRIDHLITFTKIDSSEDYQLDYDEFMGAMPILKKQLGHIDNPTKEFQKLDKANSGFISFDQFTEWSIKTKIKNEEREQRRKEEEAALREKMQNGKNS